MSAIILESSLVHYEALGRGRPLLFLHDWLGSWRYWVPTMVDLSSSYRVYALDFWGFGDSDKLASRYSIHGYVGQVELFMDQMGIGHVPIIGHGLGGIVAIQYAMENLDRVEQVMSISMPLVPEDIGRPLGSYGGSGQPARSILGRRTLRNYEEVEIEAGKTDGEAVTKSVRSAMNTDVLDSLELLDVPVLLLGGRDDPLIRPPDEDRLSSLDYNVYAVVFDRSQHYPMLDEPSKFNRLVQDFLMFGDDWDRIEVKEQWKRRMR